MIAPDTSLSRSRPWIGITTYTVDAAWGARAAHVNLVPTAYARSVMRAGGQPVLIPTDEPGVLDAQEALGRLDGLVVAGGADIDPSRYGETPHPTTRSQPERDEAELALLAAALDRDMPVLGVCRGMQLMAVTFGGRLHQHLPEVVGHSGHLPASEPGSVSSYGEHPVRLQRGSRLHAILGQAGDAPMVNSLHHQGVADPGRLTPVAWHPGDGLIEAVEEPDRAFVLGVQWHPEELPDPRLWVALVGAAASFQAAGRAWERGKLGTSWEMAR